MGYRSWNCPKCDSANYDVKELMMIGKEALKSAYWFNVFICRKCGYSEIYFKEQGYSLL